MISIKKIKVFIMILVLFTLTACARPGKLKTENEKPPTDDNSHVFDFLID